MSERERNFSVVTKTVHLRDNIADVLTRLIYDFQYKYNRLPEGLLVGPNEWLELERYARGVLRYGMVEGEANSRVRKFHGIPVYPKCRPGVDLIPGEGLIPYLAKGIAKKDDN